MSEHSGHNHDFLTRITASFVDSKLVPLVIVFAIFLGVFAVLQFAFSPASLIGMLTILVLGIRYGSDMYFEAALLIALAGFVSSAALAKFLLRGEVIE